MKTGKTETAAQGKPEGGKIEIGKIVSAVALRGEVKLLSYADEPENFEDYPQLIIADAVYRVEKVRYQALSPIIKFEGVDDRNAAELLKGKTVYVSEKLLPKLPEGVYYIKDLIGMRVISDEGKEIGVLKDVLQNTAQDLYEVETAEGKLIYIPGVKEFLLERSLEQRTIIVKLPKGLLDL